MHNESDGKRSPKQILRDELRGNEEAQLEIFNGDHEDTNWKLEDEEQVSSGRWDKCVRKTFCHQELYLRIGITVRTGLTEMQDHPPEVVDVCVMEPYETIAYRRVEDL